MGGGGAGGTQMGQPSKVLVSRIRFETKQVQSLYRPTARFYKFTLISLNFPICSDIIHYVRQIFFSVLINFTLAII